MSAPALLERDVGWLGGRSELGISSRVDRCRVRRSSPGFLSDENVVPDIQMGIDVMAGRRIRRRASGELGDGDGRKHHRRYQGARSRRA